MFFDKVAQKRYQLENQSVLFNTLQGTVLGSDGVATKLRTQFGVVSVPRAPGDRLGARRVRVKTDLGDIDIPF